MANVKTMQHDTVTQTTTRRNNNALTIVGRTADDAVVMDRSNSHIHNDVILVLKAALLKVRTNGQLFIVTEVEFPNIVGTSCCVTTGPKDKILFAQRPNRLGLTRFVVDRESEPSSKVVIVLKKMESTMEYILITAFIGDKAELEPWDPRATSTSLVFWQHKALVWGAPIIEGTITTDCPWPLPSQAK
jgi:hypothetical protein